MGARRESSEHEHGPHTLRVMRGTVVGLDGDDVFCELGPRMQGVISARSFDTPPAVGESYEFTLRGREESLWVLSLRQSHSLSSWEEAEAGSIVEARIVRSTHGGLEAKIGPLHAFLPKSQTGLAREDDPALLVGKTMTCEVLEVDAERQRVLVSRRKVLARERLGARERELGSLAPGHIVQGRVARVEPYGVFVRFGRGLEGLVHTSNLAYERIEDPAGRFQMGDSISAKVLSIKRGGKRIALGVRQLQPSPWTALKQALCPGRVVAATVTRTTDYGVFVEVRKGVEGLVHRSETGLDRARPVRGLFRVGQRLSARVLSVDWDAERLALSLLRADGARLEPDEAEAAADLRAQGPTQAPEDWRGDLGEALQRALRPDERRADAG